MDHDTEMTLLQIQLRKTLDIHTHSDLVAEADIERQLALAEHMYQMRDFIPPVSQTGAPSPWDATHERIRRAMFHWSGPEAQSPAKAPCTKNLAPSSTPRASGVSATPTKREIEMWSAAVADPPRVSGTDSQGASRGRNRTLSISAPDAVHHAELHIRDTMSQWLSSEARPQSHVPSSTPRASGVSATPTKMEMRPAPLGDHLRVPRTYARTASSSAPVAAPHDPIHVHNGCSFCHKYWPIDYTAALHHWYHTCTADEAKIHVRRLIRLGAYHKQRFVRDIVDSGRVYPPGSPPPRGMKCTEYEYIPQTTVARVSTAVRVEGRPKY